MPVDRKKTLNPVLGLKPSFVTTTSEPPHGVLGSRENGAKTTREPGAGCEKY